VVLVNPTLWGQNILTKMAISTKTLVLVEKIFIPTSKQAYKSKLSFSENLKIQGV